MTSITNREKQAYKICASNDCTRGARYQLKIIYVNKLGWFCEQCKEDLERSGLIIKEDATLASSQY
jgi:hypothetical protein